MVDMPVAVRVMRVGRARRDVIVHNRAAMRRQAFGQRGHRQRIPIHGALVLKEIRRAGVVRDKHAVLQ